jgi:H+/Cl- antiporter ClcA
MQQSAKLIIFIGLLIVIAGIILYFVGDKLHWLGRLPGDIRVEKENFSFYMPITTMILLSVVVSVLIRIYKHFF